MGAVPITVRYLPKGRDYGRPGYAMVPTSVTIHNTANEKAGADAETHARYLEAGHAISWHYTVDHDSIVQHLPITEQAWHTGTNAGNTTSVGIEVCEYPNTADGRAKQDKATDNAAWLAAELLDSNASIKRVVTHKSWSGKNCPRDILPNWFGFLALVQSYRNTTEEEDMACDNYGYEIIARKEDKAKEAELIKLAKRLDLNLVRTDYDTLQRVALNGPLSR